MTESSASAAALRVRAVVAGDLAALAALESAAFTAPWSADEIGGIWSSPGASAWLAEAADEKVPRVVAYALFREAGGEAELLRVATHPDFRRRGLAARLLAEALSREPLSSVDCHLEVRADNCAAQALYARLGFELSGVRRSYYRDGCDAWTYSRRVPPGSAG